ncbi:MAG: ABC transporter permease [Gemmatimonadaceae bacterium]
MRSRPEQARWRRYLRFWGPNVDADIDDELRYHIEMRRQDFIAHGLSPELASDAAISRFGDPAVIAHELREHDTRLLRQARRADMLHDLLQDVRYALRQLKNTPRFSITVILVLALGIGANTAIFSAVDAAFLRGLPFPAADRLVTLREIDLPSVFEAGQSQSSPRIGDLQAEPAVFERVAAYASGGLNLNGGGEPSRVNIAYVTEDFFKTLERYPILGRSPSHEEFEKGGEKSVVLSHRLWQTQFGGDDRIVGKKVQLNDVSYIVAGVMPADFQFPSDVDLWIPLQLPFGFEVMPAFRNFLPAKVVARLAPGATVATAATRADVIRHRFLSGARSTLPPEQLVQPLQQTLIGDRRTALLILMASAALLLLIACANVTNLLLSRASMRERELAVRTVLGATRGRVVRQLLVESLVLSLAGGIAAVVVAKISLGGLTAALPPALAGVAPPRVDARVLGFTLLLATMTSLVFGLWPAVGASRPDLADALKSGSGASRRRGAGARGVLVVAEVSIALMLLVGAGLMLQSLRTLLRVDTGMRTAHIVTGRLTLSQTKYPRQSAATFLSDVVTRLAAMPGIESAAAVSALPMEGAGGIALRVSPEGVSDDDTRTAMGAYLMATPGFFSTMGATVRGADLPATADTSNRVTVINETMAKKLWPNENAVGKRVAFGPELRTVIGVVSDIRNHGLDVPATEQMYFPMAEQPQSYASIVVRGGDSRAAMERIRDAVRSVDRNQPVYALRTMDDVINTSVAPRRTNTFLLTVFGAVALALAGVGVYGVLSYGVAQRTREIGVRVALGAQQADIVRLVAWQGALLTGVGIVIGLAGAYTLSRVLSSILYGVSTHDVGVFVGAPAVLAVIALLAVIIPARRATRVDPMSALRHE